MIYGYARVSTLDQCTTMQISAFQKNGIADYFEEKCSGVKDRPVLQHLLTDVLKAGDVLCVYKIDRLARSMSHFIRVFEVLKKNNVGFRSLTGSIETETAQGRMFLQMLGIFAEFEREMIRERCLAGQRAARARGKTWGVEPMFSVQEAMQLAAMWRDGWGDQKQLAAIFECSVSTMRDTIHRAEKRGRWLKPVLHH